MKKVYLLLTAICLTALTGCIKEEPYTLETATLEVNLTRAEGDTTDDTTNSTEDSKLKQGNGIKDVMVWAFQLKADGTDVLQDTAIGWRYVPNANTEQSVSVHVPLPVCNNEPQWYMLVAIINTAEFGTTFNSSTTYSQLKTMTFDASDRTFWKSYPNEPGLLPKDMPVSNWAKFLINNTNTHANNRCYTLNMPVYRAVAKTQLFVSKTSNDYALEITSASVHAGSAPKKGFVLSATAENRTGANGEDAQIGNPELSTTPTWYGTFDTADMAQFTKSLKNTTTPAATEGGQPTYEFTEVSLPKSVEDYTDVWAGSLFLYENKADGRVANYANYNYKANPAEVEGYNNHYYMQINYTIDGKEQQPGYVPLPAAVRNHDYQVHATVDAGGEMTLELNVIKWEPTNKQDVDFEDEVSLYGNGITWNAGAATISGNSITFGSNPDQTQSCTFTINTPVGGKWYAELTDGDVDAFAFESTGTTLASGEITPNKSVTLTIKTLKNNYLQGQKQVKFCMFARTADGRNLTVHLANGVDEYTIIQNEK